MKTTPILTSLCAALAIPVLAWAQDKAEPGKASDATKNPPAEAGKRAEPLRMPKDSEREPGKTSDAVKEPKPTSGDRQFTGPITAVNREEKTITINDSALGSHKLHIGATTKLKRGEKEVTWEDLKVGQTVQGTASGDVGKAHLETLTIGSGQ
jgi:hypothetical protein